LIGLCSKNSITEEDRDVLRKMSLDKDDKQIFMAWDTYLDNKDEEELVSTFQVLCNLNRKKHQDNNKPSGFGIQGI
jgi:hypothetical protein